MAEEKDNIQFELTEELIEKVEILIELKNDKELRKLLNGFHYADIAEILDELDLEDAIYVIKLLDSHQGPDPTLVHQLGGFGNGGIMAD